MENRFDEIYSLYHKDVFRLVYSYVLNRFDAEDILQKTFYKLYKNKKIINKNNDEIKKWLFRVSINEAKDLLKLPWRKVKVGGNEDVLNNPILEREKGVIESLKELPHNYRIPLYLYYYEGYNIKEIALIMNKTTSAIKMRLARGKELLKKEMEEIK